MRALVTGAGGMLGQALVPALEAAGHQVLGLGRADADVTRFEAFAHPIRVFQPDWIFHLAAWTDVDGCETDPDRAYLVNGLGARNAALAAAEAGASVLAISTDYVFDGAATRPYREYDTTAPLSVYGASKLAGERAVREVNPKHIVLRTGWLYGKGGRNFVDTILRRARAGESLRVVADQRGTPTSVTDLAPALVRLAATREFGTYHCTCAADCTWHELAAHVVRCVGLSVAVAPTDRAASDRPAQRPAYSVLSNLFFEHVTGHRMPHWQESVDRYLKPSAEMAPQRPGRA